MAVLEEQTHQIGKQCKEGMFPKCQPARWSFAFAMNANTHSEHRPPRKAYHGSHAKDNVGKTLLNFSEGLQVTYVAMGKKEQPDLVGTSECFGIARTVVVRTCIAQVERTVFEEGFHGALWNTGICEIGMCCAGNMGNRMSLEPTQAVARRIQKVRVSGCRDPNQKGGEKRADSMW